MRFWAAPEAELAVALKVAFLPSSPAKTKSIGKFLGGKYRVESSKGHLIDLPRSSMGIDIGNNFEPLYITIRGKGKTLGELRKAAKNSSEVLLATDPDHWGRGLASRLLDHADLRIAEQGGQVVELWTQRDNLRARRLYERRGWSRSRRLPALGEDGETLVHYERTLPAHLLRRARPVVG